MFQNLEFLSLASNPIEENIDAYVFQNLSQLKHLDLRNVSSPYFSPALFEPLSSLEHLDLSLNPIEDVPPLPSGIKVLYICGTNILHLGSFVMPQLLVLSLDNSANLTSVLLNNFENLTQLEILSMRDSPRLSQVRLRPMSFKLLPRLKRLSLQNCALETISSELLPIIQKTAVLDLQNNPWRCDCRMKWINAMNLTTDLVTSFR
jgi:platelet glycoprotein-5